MIYHFPPDVAKLVAEEMNARGYGSEDEVLRDALHVLRELRQRESQLIAEVKTGIDQADRGLSRELDVEALIDRCAQQLAKEGIVE